MLDKENAAGRTGIFMIDASKGFVKDGNKNRLRQQDIHKIVDVFNKQIEQPKYSRMVSRGRDRGQQTINLNIPRYIDSSEAEDLQDIEAHLLGGIPDRDIDALDRLLAGISHGLSNSCLIPARRPGYSVPVSMPCNQADHL